MSNNPVSPNRNYPGVGRISLLLLGSVDFALVLFLTRITPSGRVLDPV